MRTSIRLLGLGLLLGLLLPAGAHAQFTFTTNADYTLTITGYTGNNTSVTIPSVANGLSVAIIGDSAFSRNSKLATVVIPDSVTSIGREAFYGCSSMTNATLGNSVTNIESRAFTSCGALLEAIS